MTRTCETINAQSIDFTRLPSAKGVKMANTYGFEEYEQGLEVIDIKTGYRWRLEKR
jgi:hypothetical protein